MFPSMLAVVLSAQITTQVQAPPQKQPVLIIFSIPSPQKFGDPVCPPCEAFKRDEQVEPLRSLLRRFRIIRYTDRSPERHDYGVERYPTFWVEEGAWIYHQEGYYGPDQFRRYLNSPSTGGK